MIVLTFSCRDCDDISQRVLSATFVISLVRSQFIKQIHPSSRKRVGIPINSDSMLQMQLPSARSSGDSPLSVREELTGNVAERCGEVKMSKVGSDSIGIRKTEERNATFAKCLIEASSKTNFQEEALAKSQSNNLDSMIRVLGNIHREHSDKI